MVEVPNFRVTVQFDGNEEVEEVEAMNKERAERIARSRIRRRHSIREVQAEAEPI